MDPAGEDAESPEELESQFILRLPEEPAEILRDAIHNDSTLTDRFSIKIDDDLRHGEVRVDHHLMKAKVVDLPTIIESVETADSKSVHKTADICQMLICKEEDRQTTTEDDLPQKAKKKESNKVVENYLWPDGITPPTKGVRKHRFRKALGKKKRDIDIEEEVKRLLRDDNDAVSVKWEVINTGDEKQVNRDTVAIKKEPVESTSQNVAERDIFDGSVSGSKKKVFKMHKNSQNYKPSVQNNVLNKFSRDMLAEMQNSHLIDYSHQAPSTSSYSGENLSKSTIKSRLEELVADLSDLKARRQQQKLEIEYLENIGLRHRFPDTLDQLLEEQLEKEREKIKLEKLLKRAN